MTVQVLVGGDAAALAQQFLAAAQQFAATLNAVSTTAFDLANQSVWNGSTAERFRTEQQQLAGHLHTIGPFVIKPDGLTGGKGVKVFGEHLHSIAEAVEYCAELLNAQPLFGNRLPPVVIEDKLDGEEFSFQSFFDGKHIVHTIPVQDHKRAKEWDTGPNTGGMGSYSAALPDLWWWKEKP